MEVDAGTVDVPILGGGGGQSNAQPGVQAQGPDGVAMFSAVMEASHDAMVTLNRTTLGMVTMNTSCQNLLSVLGDGDMDTGLNVLTALLKIATAAQNKASFQHGFQTTLHSSSGAAKVVHINLTAPPSRDILLIAIQDLTVPLGLQLQCQALSMQMAQVVSVAANAGGGAVGRTATLGGGIGGGIGGASATGASHSGFSFLNFPNDGSLAMQALQPQELDNAEEGPSRKKAAKGTATRKPYRFCVTCWLDTQSFVVKAVNGPDNRTTQLGGHTQTMCPRWGDKASPTSKDHRAYGAAFKRASRTNVLHETAVEAFLKVYPTMTREEVDKYLEKY